MQRENAHVAKGVKSAKRGITLVTLAITIIILLILVGVTLGFVFGKDGIIDMAKKAQRNYIEAQNNESNTLENLYSSMLVATNDDSTITISMEKLNELISSKVKEEIQNSGGGNNPIGCIISQMGNSAPEGYLVCDGTIYEIENYKSLAQYINAQFGRYHYFGGDGETTFAVPDLRGEFLRGTGTNSHVNNGNGANVGIHQNATITPRFSLNDTNGDIGVYSDGKFRATEEVDSSFKHSKGALKYNNIKFTRSDTTTTIDAYTSRPTNTSVLYCIKY